MKNLRSARILPYKSATQHKLHRALQPAAKKITAYIIILLFIFSPAVMAQPGKIFYVKETKKEQRAKLYKNLIAGINRDLSLPLTDSTEENWIDAFYSVEMLRHRSSWVESRLHQAFPAIQQRNAFFQRAFAEMLYDVYPTGFEYEIKQVLDSTPDAKLFAICAEYLTRLNTKHDKAIEQKAWIFLDAAISNPIISSLLVRMNVLPAGKTMPPLTTLLHHEFYPQAKIVFSFQRKNRNYPGLAIVRDSAGNFVKDDNGKLWWVSQLARSISNLPGYISNGNTPQGIFRMHGLDASKSIFIGPTANIQLTMPFEISARYFLNDSLLADTAWDKNIYSRLLPGDWKNYFPLYETFYAGKGGRTEIIAHGTTVDPAWYKNQPYYPLTPTLGCLCTKELWNGETGNRLQSDQQKLVDALQLAGGADGYYIVIDLNDEQRPVVISDVLPYLK